MAHGNANTVTQVAHTSHSSQCDIVMFNVSHMNVVSCPRRRRARVCFPCRVLSHEFGVVRLYRTFSIYKRCAGCLCTSSGWFKHIEPRRTFSNHISTEIARCVEFCHMSSGWFDCTEPSLSTSLQYLVTYIDIDIDIDIFRIKTKEAAPATLGSTHSSFFCLILVYHNLTQLKKRAARAEHDII